MSAARPSPSAHRPLLHTSRWSIVAEGRAVLPSGSRRPTTLNAEEPSNIVRTRAELAWWPLDLSVGLWGWRLTIAESDRVPHPDDLVNPLAVLTGPLALTVDSVNLEAVADLRAEESAAWLLVAMEGDDPREVVDLSGDPPADEEQRLQAAFPGRGLALGPWVPAPSYRDRRGTAHPKARRAPVVLLDGR